MADEGRSPDSEPLLDPRRCPFCAADCPADLDPRFPSRVWVWRCPTHGPVAYAISIR